MTQIKSGYLIINIAIVLLVLLFIPLIDAEQNSSIDVRIDDVAFYFMYTFSVESPLYTMDSYEKLTDYPPIFRFNETYRESLTSQLEKRNESGEIIILDPVEKRLFSFKNYPQYRIYINPHYIWVHQGIRNANLSKEELHKLYSNMREFVYENISSGRFCFRGPGGDYFCPLLKQNQKYQKERWTIYIEIEKFSPEITDANSELFKKFHPEYQYFPEDIKLVKRLRHNYLFYYDHPRISETSLLNLNPKEGLIELLRYLELTEIIFARVEQQRLKVDRDIEANQYTIKIVKNRIYSTRNISELENIQKELSQIEIANSTLMLIKELETLERREREILQGRDDAFYAVYKKGIEDHNSLLSKDIESLKLKIVNIDRNYDETRSLADNKYQTLTQEKEASEAFDENRRNNRKIFYLTIVTLFVMIGLGIVGIWYERKLAKETISKMDEQIQERKKYDLNKRKNMIDNLIISLEENMKLAENIIQSKEKYASRKVEDKLMNNFYTGALEKVTSEFVIADEILNRQLFSILYLFDAINNSLSTIRDENLAPDLFCSNMLETIKKIEENKNIIEEIIDALKSYRNFM